MVQTGKRRAAKSTPAPRSGRKLVERHIKLYTDDYILCLECGLEFAALHNHLAQKHNLSAEEYLAKYGLPDDFPLVAKNMVKRQSIQAHPNRVCFPKPEEITQDKEELRRLKMHVKLKGPNDPAVPLDLSAWPDGFIVLYDGRKVKQLQRYLVKQLGMTFDDYLAEWGLPECYPKTHTSRFFNRPQERALLQAAEEERLKACREGRPWPSWRELAGHQDSASAENGEGIGKRPIADRSVRKRERSRWVKKVTRTRTSRRKT